MKNLNKDVWGALISEFCHVFAEQVSDEQWFYFKDEIRGAVWSQVQWRVRSHIMESVREIHEYTK